MSISVIGTAAASTGLAFTSAAVLTSSQTWTHPGGPTAVDPKPVYVIIAGAGGGGASGTFAVPANTSTNACVIGGGGGGAGYVVEGMFSVTSSVSVTVGAAGTGGAGSSGGSSYSNGNNGTSGGNSSFGSMLAFGGDGGDGGNAFVGVGTGEFMKWARGGSLGGGIYSQTLTSGNGDSYGESSVWKAGQSDFVTNTNGHTPTIALAQNQPMLISMNQSYTVGSPVNDATGVRIFEASNLLATGGRGGYYGTNNGAGANRTLPALTAYSGVLGTGGSSGTFIIGSSGTVTATAGAVGSGYSAGGGGGGCAILKGSGTAVSGAGGNGAPGVVIVLY
jgi:hypothetical protein